MSSGWFPPVATTRLASMRWALPALPCLLSLILGASSASAMQRGPYVRLDIILYLEGQRQPYDKEVTITLRDGWGNVESAETTDRGYAQLTVTGAGNHRLLVTGTEIERYDEEFNLDTMMGRSLTIQLQPRKTSIKKTKPG